MSLILFFSINCLYICLNKIHRYSYLNICLNTEGHLEKPISFKNLIFLLMIFLGLYMNMGDYKKIYLWNQKITVLVSAGIEFISFTVAGMGLCFEFLLNTNCFYELYLPGNKIWPRKVFFINTQALCTGKQFSILKFSRSFQFWKQFIFGLH